MSKKITFEEAVEALEMADLVTISVEDSADSIVTFRGRVEDQPAYIVASEQFYDIRITESTEMTRTNCQLELVCDWRRVTLSLYKAMNE